jgi:hypothetical protein
VRIQQLIKRVREFQSHADSQIQQYKGVADTVNDIDVHAMPQALSGLTVTATEHAERLLALQDAVYKLDEQVAAAADEREVEVALTGAVPAQVSMEQKVSCVEVNHTDHSLHLSTSDARSNSCIV